MTNEEIDQAVELGMSGIQSEWLERGSMADKPEADADMALVRRLGDFAKAAREIVQAIAEQRQGAFGSARDVVLCYDDNADRLECPWCYGHEVTHGSEHSFEHEPDCPVTKARALLAEGQ